MSQHDFNIANQTAVNARTDINNALVALASLNSGTAAPSTTFANMLWYETDTNRLYIRNEANTAWLDFGYIDQTGGFRPLDNTPVVTTAGTQTGVLGDQTTATWQAGTGTTQSLVSPANIKSAINALAPTPTPTGIEQGFSLGSLTTFSLVNGSSHTITDAGKNTYLIEMTFSSDGNSSTATFSTCLGAMVLAQGKPATYGMNYTNYAWSGTGSASASNYGSSMFLVTFNNSFTMTVASSRSLAFKRWKVNAA